MGRRARTSFVTIGIAVAILVQGLTASAVDPIPSLKLTKTEDETTAVRYGRRQPAFVDPGVWVDSVDGAFELRVKRPADYSAPATIDQVDATNPSSVLRDLPEDVLNGWNGLVDFFEIVVRRPTGAIANTQLMTFCPNGFQRERQNDSGPLNPIYPGFCGGGNPFTRGFVWGIEDGWGVNPIGFDNGVTIAGPDGHYTLEISITDRYRDLFEISDADAEATVGVQVRTTTAPREFQASTADAPPPCSSPNTTPDPATLPDLTALPGWNFGISRANDRDFLDFAATEWNEGPQPVVVEGFRRTNPPEPRMDAFQYFFQNGAPVGCAPIGQLVYHAGGGHDHWHLLQFVEYTLHKMDGTMVRKSGKQSWCLVPTDAIDLTVPNADWGAEPGRLGSSCGGRSSRWIRETLPVGWGDTYHQSLAGQAFRISGLPNGSYIVRIHVNPSGVMYEGGLGAANNIVDRVVRLRGVPGARRVIVDPWNGITD